MADDPETPRARQPLAATTPGRAARDGDERGSAPGANNDAGGESGGKSEEPLQDVVAKAVEDTEGEEEISVGELTETFGTRSFGPILVLFGLLALFPPIGAIPGVPIILGATLLLFAVQFAVGRDHIWLPSRLKRASFARAKLEKAQEKSAKWLERLDKLFKERLTFAAGPRAERLAAYCAVLHALLMLPLEFVSLVALPGVALTAFGVGLMARDGFFMIIAFTATAAAIGSLFLVPWGSMWASIF